MQRSLVEMRIVEHEYCVCAEKPFNTVFGLSGANLGGGGGGGGRWATWLVFSMKQLCKLKKTYVKKPS